MPHFVRQAFFDLYKVVGTAACWQKLRIKGILETHPKEFELNAFEVKTFEVTFLVLTASAKHIQSGDIIAIKKQDYTVRHKFTQGDGTSYLSLIESNEDRA